MKALIFCSLVLALGSRCNNASHEEKHTQTDSITTHHADTSQGSPMQQLMHTMMNDMFATKSTGNNDVDFAQHMLVHHQGAVKMAELQIEKGSSEPLKEFSRNLVKTQMAEIDTFKRVLSVTSPVITGDSSDFHKAMQTGMHTMMAQDHQSKDIDTDFAELMIGHHLGAVDMAKAYLKFGTNIGLKNISNAIIQTQAKEIDWLNEWLKNKK